MIKWKEPLALLPKGKYKTMRIIDGKIILEEEDREFLAHMVSLNMIKEITSVSLRNLAQIWYDRGHTDADEK